MLFFVSPSGKVLVTTSAILSNKTTLSIPLLDTNLRFLTVQSRFDQKPAMQVHGTIGGSSYIRVLGEDPPMITLSGLITGSTNCNNARLVESAFKSGVDFFIQNSVVQNALPVTYSLGAGSTIRDAFIVAMSLDASESFADVIQFSLTLLSEPVVRIKTPATFSGAAPAAGANANAVADNTRSSTAASYVSASSDRSLLTRVVAANTEAISPPLGAGVRSSRGSLISSAGVGGIVLQTAG